MIRKRKKYILDGRHRKIKKFVNNTKKKISNAASIATRIGKKALSSASSGAGIGFTTVGLVTAGKTPKSVSKILKNPKLVGKNLANQAKRLPKGVDINENLPLQTLGGRVGLVTGGTIGAAKGVQKDNKKKKILK